MAMRSVSFLPSPAVSSLLNNIFMPSRSSKAVATKAAAKMETSIGPQKTRLWLTYPPKLITQPLIWELAQKFKVITNIRQASVSDTIGIVCLELEGERTE